MVAVVAQFRTSARYRLFAVVISVIVLAAILGFFTPATAHAWDVLGVKKMIQEFAVELIASFCKGCVQITVALVGFLTKNSLLDQKLDAAMPAVFTFVSRVAKEVTGPLGECLVFIFIALRFASAEDERQRGSSEDSELPEAYTWLHFLIMQFLVMHSTEVIVFIFNIVNKLLTASSGGLIALGTTQSVSFTGLDALLNLPLDKLAFDLIGILLVMLVLFILQVLVICIVYLVSWVIVYGLFLMLYIYIAVAPIPLASLINPTFKSIGERFFKRVASTSLTFFVITLIFYLFPLMLASVSFVAIPTPADLLAGTSVTDIAIFMNLVIACLQYLAMDIVLLVALVRSGAISKEILDV
jgi:hypothetical protein